MACYQVKDWNEHYENFRSREVDLCKFVCVPNKQDGLGLQRVLSQPDGAAIYGIFCLIVGACSRQRRPRNGWLTSDGTESGLPWTAEDLAFRWRRSRDELVNALAVLSGEQVGWLKLAKTSEEYRADTAAVSTDSACQTAAAELLSQASPLQVKSNSKLTRGDHTKYRPSTDEVSTQYRCSTLNGKKERREGIEEERMSTFACPEPANTPASGPPDSNLQQEEPVFSFPVIANSDKPWNLTRKHFLELGHTFEGLNVLAECKKALSWLKSDKTRRKTPRGMPRFLHGWMSRANDRGSSSNARYSTTGGRNRDEEMLDRAFGEKP